MKTATLTFHGSHNYGSMLQAYALQQVLKSVYGHNEIINYRPLRQKRMMKVLTFRPRVETILKDLSHCLYLKSLTNKHTLFEHFLQDYLCLTDEVHSIDKIDLCNYDLLCSGSDQIWNPCPEDFDFAYLQDFEYQGKKISYAVSMGPGRNKWPNSIKRYPPLLNSFNRISVREEGTKKIIEELSGRNDISVNCDPVFLIPRSDWLRLAGETPIIKEKYIFLYTLFANPLIVQCADYLKNRYGIPVVISNFTNMYDLFGPFIKHLETGPIEFLNLLSHADKIITSSFHGTAFSVIMNKPFVVINGLRDNRISNLLRSSGLESRSVASVSELQLTGWEYSYRKANDVINIERSKSLEFLRNCQD